MGILNIDALALQVLMFLFSMPFVVMFTPNPWQKKSKINHFYPLSITGCIHPFTGQYVGEFALSRRGAYSFCTYGCFGKMHLGYRNGAFKNIGNKHLQGCSVREAGSFNHLMPKCCRCFFEKSKTRVEKMAVCRNHHVISCHIHMDVPRLVSSVFFSNTWHFGTSVTFPQMVCYDHFQDFPPFRKAQIQHREI